MTAQEWISEALYCLIGLVFLLCGAAALRDRALSARITTAVFWFLLAFAFITGPYLPGWVAGLAIVAIACVTALKGVRSPRLSEPPAARTRANADRLGYRVFLPALVLALSAVLVAALTNVGANNAVGVAALIALAAALIITRSPVKNVAADGERLTLNIGPIGILPQILASLGALFTAAGVGDVLSGAISVIIPEGSRLLGVTAYCAGMAVFTVIMGNGFAAFSVMTVGVGIPFVIAQGGSPIIVGALGLTAGYCGTLVTPMAANFNMMPAALLGTKSKYAIIRRQAPVAAAMLAVHIILMYVLAF